MENEHLLVVQKFVAQLVQVGCRHICISPGSRSTPLTISFNRHPEAHVYMLLDERSAGFFALGLSRALGEPVALVCTSGTAAANYFPAVVEARHGRVPLIVLTADRPHELRGIGSNQTIDQVKMYGTYSKWYTEMPVPDGDGRCFAHAERTAVRAVASAMSLPRGPVHINLPFREPLVPKRLGTPIEVSDVRHFVARLTPSDEAQSYVCSLLQSSKRPLIVCGPLDEPQAAEAISTLARSLKIPVLADPLSQLRMLGPSSVDAIVIAGYDLLLRDKRQFEILVPDLILRFGGTPTSKVLGQYLQHHANVTQIVVDTDAAYRDAFETAIVTVQAEAALFAYACVQAVPPVARETAWSLQWRARNAAVAAVIADMLRFEVQHEGTVFAQILPQLQDGSTLVLGNSMPIRDADSLLPVQQKSVKVVSNRGVSGIDGVVATALGQAAAKQGPTVLVIGDVSFYHDLNSLLIANQHQLDLVIVLVYNDGGGIFSFLPQASEAGDTFHAFRTQHGVDFSFSAAMFGGTYSRPSQLDELASAVKSGISAGGLHIVEWKTDPDENVQAHRRLDALIQERMEAEGWLDA